ncbi:MAG: PAS domain-containing protein [Actinomycetota bacterium]
MVDSSEKNLWKLLWEYDPNGLLVVDTDLNIKVVNPALCQMFKVRREDILGKQASELLGDDVESFQVAWDKNQVIRGKEKEYPQYQLFVREVIFPIKDENIIAVIMVDITQDWQLKKEMINLKAETVKKVNEVVDNQMKVAQEIAGLLGETTAATKVSLLKIISMVEEDI